jgi:hypothetical protein
MTKAQTQAEAEAEAIVTAGLADHIRKREAEWESRIVAILEGVTGGEPDRLADLEARVAKLEAAGRVTAGPWWHGG